MSFNYGAWKSQARLQPDELQNGTLTVNPFFSSLYYFVRLGDRAVTPYLFIGGGYVFSSFKSENVVTIPEITFSQNVNNSPGGQVGAGIKIEVSKRMSLMGDISFFMSKTSGTTIIHDLNNGTTMDEFTLKQNAIIFQLGVQFLI